MTRRTKAPPPRAFVPLLALAVWAASCGTEEPGRGKASNAGSSGTGSGGLSTGGRATGGSGMTGGRGGSSGTPSAGGGTGAEAGAGDVGGTGTGGATPTGGTGGKGGMPPVATGTISGFGVNGQPRNWGTDGRAVKPALDLLVNDLGANLFRVELYHGASDWEATNDDADPTNFSWSAYDAIFEGKRFTDLWNYVRYLNTLGITEIELAAHGLVPGWLGTTAVSAANEDEYIETLLAVLVYATTRAPEPKPIFTMFSPWNETNLGPPEGINLTRQQGVPILRRLIDRMGEFPELAGIMIVGPEAHAENLAAEWRSDLLDDPVILGRLRAVSFHRYGAYPQTMEWQGVDPPMWLTEFNDWDSYCYTADWNNALNLAMNLIGGLQSGVTAGLVWTDYDAPHIHDNDNWETFGLLSASYRGSADLCTEFAPPPPSAAELDAITYAPKPTYQAMKHAAHYIERGARRIEVSQGQAGVEIVGYRNPDGGTVVYGANVAGMATIQITFGDAAMAPSSLTPVVSTDGSYLVSRAPLAVSGGSVSFAVPGSSVFTLVSQ